MKRPAVLIAAILFLLSISAEDLMARGGGGGFRGGGGGGFHGGGGGAYRSSGAVHRSPSMSRPSSARPAVQQPSRPQSRQAMSKPASSPKKASPPKQQIASRPGTGAGPGSRPPGGRQGDRVSRPTQGQVQQFLNLPQGQQPGRGSDLAKIGAGAAVGALGAEGARRLLEGQRLEGQERPTQLPERPGVGDRPGLAERPGIAQRPGGPDRPSQLPSRPAGDQIRDNLQNRYDHLFTPDWWRDHPNAAKAYWDNFGKYQYARNHWWRPATWAAIAGLTAGAVASAGYGEPVYYDYGDTIYYEGENVYVGGQKAATAEEYYQQAGDLAASAPAVKDAQPEDWLPLGVFALSQDNVASSNMVLQLAINKDGVIAGTYYNTGTDTVRPIKGMVDKKSQRAAWTFADGKNTDIIMETGIYNLTQDETEALVHFGKDKTQQWLMVRLKEPQEDKSAGKNP
ncbi:MAG: hypothetical protein AB1733_16700 [Thermodesulfobacteriota bacterium]